MTGPNAHEHSFRGIPAKDLLYGGLGVAALSAGVEVLDRVMDSIKIPTLGGIVSGLGLAALGGAVEWSGRRQDK